jgi:hypothetical protein
MQRQNTSTAVQLCDALCPASQTKVFVGNDIGQAVASDGTRYSSLKNAFVYRDRIVQSCTCNGKDQLGLASIDSDADPTLRAGDIVVGADGTRVVAGKSAIPNAKVRTSVAAMGRTGDIPRRMASHAAAELGR